MATCLSKLRGRDILFHDITIAYNDYHMGKRTSEYSLLLGEFPHEIHLCVQRFHLDDVPAEKGELDEWLKELFLRKEKILKEFYENNSTVNDNAAGRDFKWPPLIDQAPADNAIFSVITMTVSSFLLLFLLLHSILLRYLVMIFIIACLLVTRLCKGLDTIELILHRELMNGKELN